MKVLMDCSRQVDEELVFEHRKIIRSPKEVPSFVFPDKNKFLFSFHA